MENYLEVIRVEIRELDPDSRIEFLKALGFCLSCGWDFDDEKRVCHCENDL